MLYRKIEKFISEYFESDDSKILVLEGARQVGKSYILREVGKRYFPNFVEINFAKDKEGPRIYEKVGSAEEFFLTLSSWHGSSLGNYEDTLIMLDEIQEYPQYLTWLKFFREERRFHFVATGSLLGVALRKSVSIPVGSILVKNMYQLDFEEFLIANGVGDDVLEYVKGQFTSRKSLTEALHMRLMDLFRRYLIVGGLPDAVNTYLATHNIFKVRQVQTDIHSLYQSDAVKYERDFARQMSIKRIYDMIPSQMENRKKRIVVRDINDKVGDRFDNYVEDFEYLTSSGIALAVNAITNPRFPLMESMQKNLVKLYLNDVGLLTNVLYRENIRPILDNTCSVNLGALYENVVAQELKAHGHRLFYYDQRKVGEVDFLVDDYATLSPLPIEVKSGKDYYVHSALDRMLKVKDYGIKGAVVLSNEREVHEKEGVIYMPIYYVMHLDSSGADKEWVTF